MKHLFKYLFIALVVSGFVFTSCEDDVAEKAASEILSEYLEEIDLDLNHVIKNTNDQKFVMGAPADGNLSGKHVIDIRSAATFAEGHISGAVNVALADILTEAASATKPILVVCYTGQTACYATSLLRLYGYSDAQALKWGMSGWSPTTDSWTGKIGNIADGHANWSYGTAPSNNVYEMPEIDGIATLGMDLLKERVEAVLAGGFKTVSGADVLNNPADYQVNNYFSDADYAAFGHVDGAHRINPLLMTDGSVKALNPDAKVVTYCYTGQTSAVITAYLRVLGYDAYSLTFGVNGLFNAEDSWTTNQWGGDSKSKDLDLVQ